MPGEGARRMKLLVVHDEQDRTKTDLAYLFYHEKSKRFYIEWEAGAAELPMGLASYAKQGQLSLNSAQAQLWVEERLAAVTLETAYQDNAERFQALRLSKGRCSEDSYKLCHSCEHRLSRALQERHARLIEDVVPLEAGQLLVFFKNSQTRKLALAELKELCHELEVLQHNEELFSQVEVLAEGLALGWGKDLELTYTEIMDRGLAIPLTRQDFLSFVNYRIFSTCQATELLGCTRQNINYLVEKQHLTPINKDKRTRLFLKQELLEKL